MFSLSPIGLFDLKELVLRKINNDKLVTLFFLSFTFLWGALFVEARHDGCCGELYVLQRNG
jgi:hypothetical protein